MVLSFLNSNWHRNYPLRGDLPLIATSGSRLPNDIIVGCRLLIDATNYVNYELSVSKVYCKNGFISIEFITEDKALGIVQGTVTEDNTVLNITPFVPTFSGFVIVGNPAQLQDEQCYNFALADGKVEPSAITVYPIPSITGMTHEETTLTGNITFDSDNLIKTLSAYTINFVVLAPTDVASRGDRTSSMLTCVNPIISGINSVKPFPVENGNNIDIYGIAPVVISTAAGKVTVTSNITIEDVCKPNNIPPTNESNSYITDIATTTNPEWKTWPQYNV